MRKVYTKPMIVYEDFSVDTNIAGTCESIVDNQNKGTCALLGTGGIAMFNDSIDACDYTPEDSGGKEDEWDGFCYHVPTEYNNLFNS